MANRQRAAFLACAFSATLAGSAPAQVTRSANERPRAASLLERTAHLRVDGVALAAALEQLARTSGVALAYSPSLLPAVTVTCPCASNTVGEALGVLLRRTGFTFREEEEQVILAPRLVPRVPANGADARLASVGALGVVRAQDDPPPISAPPEPAPPLPTIVTGRITSEGGSPVVGAAVTLRRTNLTATTDRAGHYRIAVPVASVVVGPDTLRVDRIGYTAVEVPFELRDGDVRVHAVLPLQAVALDQIVVTGTAGRQQRRAQAAVVATVDAVDVMDRAPVASISELLGGRVAGVSVTGASGATGTSARINIRGAASLALSNEPLVFIDGVRMESQQRRLVAVGGQTLSALDDLNPSDIERIEIVKGPAAATLYGADASAGVIQIITRRGAGPRRFTQTLVTEFGSIQPAFEPYDNYARCTAPLVAVASENPLCRGLAPGAVVTDNPLVRQNAFRDGRARGVMYSASGGGESHGYYISGGIDHEVGTTRNNLLQRRTGRASFQWLASPRLSVEASFAMARNENRLPQGDQSVYGYLIGAGLGSPLTVNDRDGTLSGGWLLGAQSVAAISAIEARVTTLRSTPTAQIHYTPVPWFTNRLTLGADVNQSAALDFYPRNDHNWYSGDQENGWVRSTRSNVTTYTLDYTGNLAARFGDGRLTSDLSFGSQYILRSEDLLRGVGVGLSANSSNLVSGAATNSSAEGYTEQASLGLFAQEQIGLDDHLFLQLGARVDRNSAFGAAAGAFFLPKLGASWVVSSTTFGRALAPLLSTLRLRVAYGTTGRSPTPGASLETYAAVPYVTETGALRPGVIPLNPGNAELRPERGRELEAGLDAGFLGDRAGLELTYFEKRTSDLLVRVPQPPSSGYVHGAASNPYQNIGKVLNRGVELSLRTRLLDRRSLTWDAALTASTLHNELLDLGGIEPFQISYRAFTPGRQLGAWYVNRIRAVDTVNSRVIVSDTAEYLGNQIPTFQGSLHTTLALFGGLRVYALLDGRSGSRVYNLGQEYRDRFYRNSADVVLGPEEGGYTTHERLRRFGPYQGEEGGRAVALTEVKEDYIQRGDFLRFRELTASVGLPGRWVRRVGAASASLTVGGRNLGVWSAFDGFDPEVLGTGPGTVNSMYYDQFYTAEVFTTPPARRWIARLNVQF